MRDRHEIDVLAPLARELRREPVLRDLVTRLERSGPARRRTWSRPAPVLAVGLVLMLAGCVALSVPVAAAGVGTALVALVVAAHRTAAADGSEQ